MTLTRNGETISTYQQLLKNVFCDESSCSGNRYTQSGEFKLNGKPVFVYRHWSYDGNFHVYSDKTLTHTIAEVIKKGKPFPYLDENGKPVMNGIDNVYDWKISIVKK